METIKLANLALRFLLELCALAAIVWGTFSLQARPFYERFGYEVFGKLPDYPAGHAYYFMKETLEDPERAEPG